MDPLPNKNTTRTYLQELSPFFHLSHFWSSWPESQYSEENQTLRKIFSLCSSFPVSHPSAAVCSLCLRGGPAWGGGGGGESLPHYPSASETLGKASLEGTFTSLRILNITGLLEYGVLSSRRSVTRQKPIIQQVQWPCQDGLGSPTQAR